MFANALRFSTRIWKIFTIYYLVVINGVESGLREKIGSNGVMQLKMAIREFVQSSATHDVTLITNDIRPDNWSREINNAMYEGAAGHLPLYSFTSQEIRSITLKPLNVLTSRSLVIYNEYEITSERIPEMLTDVFSISGVKQVPKILCAFIYNGKLKLRIRSLFEYFARLRIVNINVLEIIQNGKEIRFLTMHQYDYRTKNYTTSSFSTNVNEWYPDRVNNLLGSNFNLYYTKKADPQYRLPNGKNEFVLPPIRGILNTMEELMNFTITLDTNIYVDFSHVDVPLKHTPSYDTTTEHTVPTRQERVCLVIPKMAVESPGVSPWKCVIAVLLGLSVIFIFWLFLTLMKANRKLKHPINIFGLIFGQAITEGPRTLCERILFICLIVSSTRYTAMFYTELFNLAVIQDGELNIANLEEFEKSGLQAIVDETFYHETFMNNDEVTSTVMERIRPADSLKFISTYMIGLRKYDNISIFTGSENIILFCQRMEKLYKKPVAKVSDFCLFAMYRTFRLTPKSPLKPRIDDIILRITEAGLLWKWSQY